MKVKNKINTPGIYKVTWGPKCGQYLPKFVNVSFDLIKAMPF